MLCFYNVYSQGMEEEKPADTELRQIEIIPLPLHGFDLSWIKGELSLCWC